MLLLHQSGAVKVGQVVRYTITYQPANDRVLPTPSHLHVKVKNTAALPLRAAWVHGPYTLHTSAYPATFNPHQKVQEPRNHGTPEYEPMLKANGSWTTKLVVPEEIREKASDLGKQKQHAQASGVGDTDSVTWIVEIASQILFSNSASVPFELLVGRDERSLDLGFAAVVAHGHGGPGQVQQHSTDRDRWRARKSGHSQTAGVFSKAVKLAAEDTEALWDKPPLPGLDEEEGYVSESAGFGSEHRRHDSKKPRKRKRVHLVVVTHGLHGNLGADMLFLKESIDATVKQARLDKQKRKESKHNQETGEHRTTSHEMAQHVEGGRGDNKHNTSTAPLSGGQEDVPEHDQANEDSDDEEETIVRGFPGNAVKTENGIQFLGKRLAKYILSFTYPDQPFLPVKKSLTRVMSETFKSDANKTKRDDMQSHSDSALHGGSQSSPEEVPPYKFTSISFIGHSLGGLIQTYAVAYIHKHSPNFFQQIKPINFICMASPMLGLSNENPMYVKFALDFGLVGRTGQDLGLTWRPPTLARGGWNAVVGGFGGNPAARDQGGQQGDPTSKPLLRILPTGPAHQVLKLFRNRTVYSNVVNDGIVPLRTSCLLFLDWRGLGKVDKARRENGLIGTVAEWGWAELTGQSSSALTERVAAEKRTVMSSGMETDGDEERGRAGDGDSVPQPRTDETAEDARALTTRPSFDETTLPRLSSDSTLPASGKGAQQGKAMWDNLVDWFRPSASEPAGPSTRSKRSSKTSKALQRGQTISREENSAEEQSDGQNRTTENPTMRPHQPHMSATPAAGEQKKRPTATRGSSTISLRAGEAQAPPKTSIFESAGDILHPALPSKEWITDPSSRSQVIFHDRVYHPEDIPASPLTKTATRSSLSSTHSTGSQESADTSSGMKVEEKIARAYHRDLSWRKVLVRLQPDAHNNMIVRRMFGNAYGWPVIQHLCDTHFSDTHTAITRDEDEAGRERPPLMNKGATGDGEEVREHTAQTVAPRSASEAREATDELVGLSVSHDGANSINTAHHAGAPSREGSVMWDDACFDGSDDDSDTDERGLMQRMMDPFLPAEKSKAPLSSSPNSTPSRYDPQRPQTPPTSYTDGHRGLAPISPRATRSAFGALAPPAEPVSPAVTDTLVEERESAALGKGTTSEVGLGRRSVEASNVALPDRSAAKNGRSSDGEQGGQEE